LSLLRDSKEPWLLANIESSASGKGVVRQAVKDVVKELADEGAVTSEKIGTTTYYWSFPGDEINKKNTQITDATQSIASCTTKLKDLESENKRLHAERNPTEERKQKLQTLKQLQEKIVQFEEELKKHSDADPALLDAMEVDIKTSVEAANRWTDNIFDMRSYLVKKFNQDINALNKHFEIPSDFDYVQM